MSALEPGSDEDPQRDPMAPPQVPCECYCLHCRRVFMSNEMWFQKVINASDGFPGFWMCPTPNCSGAGYGFDIYPTDPDHPDNADWYDDNDAEEEDEFNPESEEYDPAETKYQDFDEEWLEDEDMEGEEWKYGIDPTAPAEESEASRQARLEWEEEQKKYDEPDRRPRVLDWKDEPRPATRTDDDVPF